jgi:hypothetical protein
MPSQDSSSNQWVPSMSEIVDYYSKDDILNEMMKISRDREFVGAYKNGSYYKRPNIIQFPSDIIQMAKNHVTSFHCSVERWNNPMQISTQTKNYSDLRKGFDFLIDIDSKIGVSAREKIKATQSCSAMICAFLRKYGVKNYGVKFSGSRGFHIIVPYEAFPAEINYRKTSELYPRIPQVLADFIRDQLKDKILDLLVRDHSAKKLYELSHGENLDPFKFIDIENGWGERHLFRAPFSLNEKTWFVSLPLRDPIDFSEENVRMKNVKIKEHFLKPCKENEIKDLLKDALNWAAKKDATKPKKTEIKKEFSENTEKIPEEAFPPCVKNILKGLEDGKKRGVFTLINFLRSMNWNWEEIETRILVWNSLNPKPLPVNFIKGQINWNHNQQKRPPANCTNDLYYKSIGICIPDENCRKIKNPVTYPFKKMNFSTKRSGKQIITCRQCRKTFESEKSLRMHQSRAHGESMTD